MNTAKHYGHWKPFGRVKDAIMKEIVFLEHYFYCIKPACYLNLHCFKCKENNLIRGSLDAENDCGTECSTDMFLKVFDGTDLPELTVNLEGRKKVVKFVYFILV